MKKIQFFYSALVALGLSASLVSCSNSDDSQTPPPPPGTAHYDLTVTVGKHGGMNQDDKHYTLSIASLSNPDEVINFEGNGAEITEYTMENIYDGKYMYQVPNTNNHFSKLQFKDNKLQVIQDQPFVVNTYLQRKYAHTWLDGKTLLIVSADGTNKKFQWTKLNATDMKIIEEGDLNIAPADGETKWIYVCTSGLLSYRQSDKKVFFFYFFKDGTGRTAKNEGKFRTAVINPEDMTIEQNFVNTEAQEVNSSSFGELLQTTSFYDEQGNLYLSCFDEVSTKKYKGKLLRIKKGSYQFEEGYNAFPEAKGKLLSTIYMGNGKVMAYSGDNAVGSGIQEPAYYYSVIDLNSQSSTRLQYKGQDLGYSGGSFSQRVVYNPHENKAYVGVDTSNEQRIYVYDVATGAVSQGAQLAPGYYFEQIRYFEE
jgi:hypothetical protein